MLSFHYGGEGAAGPAGGGGLCAGLAGERPGKARGRKGSRAKSWRISLSRSERWEGAWWTRVGDYVELEGGERPKSLASGGVAQAAALCSSLTTSSREARVSAGRRSSDVTRSLTHAALSPCPSGSTLVATSWSTLFASRTLLNRSLLAAVVSLV